MRLKTEDILAAAEELFAETGEAPTIRAVRDRLGRGSMSTITSVMSAWRQERERLAQVPAPVVVACMRAAGQIWHEVQARMSGEGAGALDSAVAELEAQMAWAHTRIQQLEGESEQRRVAIHQLHRTIAAADRRATESDRAAVAATARAEVLAEALETLAGQGGATDPAARS